MSSDQHLKHLINGERTEIYFPDHLCGPFWAEGKNSEGTFESYYCIDELYMHSGHYGERQGHPKGGFFERFRVTLETAKKMIGLVEDYHLGKLKYKKLKESLMEMRPDDEWDYYFRRFIPKDNE